jgi:hypothetical protein
MTNPTKRKRTAPRPKGVSKTATNVSNKNLTLLSPEVSGWVKIQEWPKLFVLYRCGKKIRAELQPELADTEKRLESGHSENDFTADKLSRAFGHLAFLQLAEKAEHIIKADSPALMEFRRCAIQLLTEALGEHAEKMFFSPKVTTAENAVMDLVALVKRSGEGILKRRFNPVRGRGTSISLALLAIWHAKAQCERHGRLASKAEIQECLSAIGLGFSEKCKDTKGRWREVFDRAGLSDLPDYPP